ncbi:MAG: HPr family phosphocarrier protein [Lachnospiraceae bacterium]|nr:HPr family phosphocarrier protein [Lachnospiraceae bacterium]MCD7956543.1 HPr family phosphocarrier protein [Lachnospiraceae bacterium]
MQKRLKIKNELGLHLRPAGELCTLAMEFESKITIHFRDREFNAKSLLSVLSACVQSGDEIVMEFEGPDEEEASARISAFIEGLR